MKYYSSLLLLLLFINCNQRINEINNVKFDVNKFNEATYNFIINNCDISPTNYLKNENLPILIINGNKILNFKEHLSQYTKFRKLFFQEISINPLNIQFNNSIYVTEYYSNDEIVFSIDSDRNKKYFFNWNSIDGKFDMKEEDFEYDFILNFKKGNCFCQIDRYFNNLIIYSEIDTSKDEVKYETKYISIITN